MKSFLIFFSTIFFFAGTTSAQTVSVNNFIVKEHLLKNSKLAIIAADSVDNPNENVNGTFIFSINGFEQQLKFNDGIAVTPQPIAKSSFVYFKHKNESGTHSKLFYVIKKGDSLNPIKINWMLLILIPVLVIVIISMFKKFILFGVVILAALFYFNSSKGLGLPTFFETIFDGLKSLI